MKRYIYPAVFVKDKEKNEFSVIFPDLEIATDGRFVEEAYLYAKASLKAYILYAEKFDMDYNQPTLFENISRVTRENEYVLLVEADINEKELLKEKID